MSATAKKIDHYTPTPGDVVVLRGLTRRAGATEGTDPGGPKLGKLVRIVGDGRWFVQLYQASPFRTRENYCRRARLVYSESIDRLATPRERTLGAVISIEAVRP
ncbi:MAG TPA: hypothetical protein VE261_01590 [Gaiellaceae bacterium]|jgi:hypothetical protein|nr:hypothetical protein [Gaiellaceae bacterium]